MRTNTLSALGRMSYSTHALFYPGVLGLYVFVYAPYAAEKAKKVEEGAFDELSAARTVDPDLFNPFTPVPYHNNPELKYVFAHINMRNYINENQINVKDYVWKNYHNSFDHGNKKTHMYNWVPK